MSYNTVSPSNSLSYDMSYDSIKQMWLFHPSILSVIGAECMRCENVVLSKFLFFSWNSKQGSSHIAIFVSLISGFLGHLKNLRWAIMKQTSFQELDIRNRQVPLPHRQVPLPHRQVPLPATQVSLSPDRIFYLQTSFRTSQPFSLASPTGSLTSQTGAITLQTGYLNS